MTSYDAFCVVCYYMYLLWGVGGGGVCVSVIYMSLLFVYCLDKLFMCNEPCCKVCCEMCTVLLFLAMLLILAAKLLV